MLSRLCTFYELNLVITFGLEWWELLMYWFSTGYLNWGVLLSMKMQLIGSFVEKQKSVLHSYAQMLFWWSPKQRSVIGCSVLNTEVQLYREVRTGKASWNCRASRYGTYTASFAPWSNVTVRQNEHSAAQRMQCKLLFFCRPFVA